jgi:hypothetical protein
MAFVDDTQSQGIVDSVNRSREYFDNASQPREYLGFLNLNQDQITKLRNEVSIALEKGGFEQCYAMEKITTYMIMALQSGMEKGELNERHWVFIHRVLMQISMNNAYVLQTLHRQYNLIQSLPNKRAAAAKEIMPLVNNLRLNTINTLSLENDPKIQKHGVILRKETMDVARRTRDAAVDLYGKFDHATFEVDFYDDEDMDGMVFDAHGNPIGSGLPDRGTEWHKGFNRRKY